MLVLFYDKDKESRESAFKENDIGISGQEKDEMVKTLKNNKNAKVVMHLYAPFVYEILIS